MHKNIPIYLFIVLQFLFVGVWVGCNDQIVDTGPFTSKNKICFTKLNNGRGQIFTANIDGTNLTNISADYPYDDDYALWSPNGEYLVFQRSAPINGPFIYTYNVKTGSLVNLTSDGMVAETTPRWTPDNRVFFVYRKTFNEKNAVYLMNPDGSNKKKILNLVARTIYFYKDCYNFLYIDDNKLYKTNIDNTYTEFIRDLETPPTVIRDFDVSSNELLIVLPGKAGNEIATLNTNTKEEKVYASARDGYGFGRCNYSNDYKQIVLIESGLEDSFLSVFKNGEIKRLVHLVVNQPNSFDYFGWAPLSFSPDGKYIIYTKICFEKVAALLPKQNISYSEYLYVINIEKQKADFLGMAWNPSFNNNP